MNLRSVCPACFSPLAADAQTCPACSHDLTRPGLHAAPTEPGQETELWEAESFPRQVGEFTLLAPLGRGGSASVYLAYQESMRRRVALKVLDSTRLPWRSDETRFEHEAWIAGRFSHPNIVRVYERGVFGPNRFIVMEFVEGRSLAAFLTEARTRRHATSVSDSAWRRDHIRQVVEWFVGVADALEYVHRQGVIHRDIKPLNLLLTRGDTRLLISDFGLARDQAAERVTLRGDFLGTIRYMSPEQLLAQRATIDYRTDLWSLGVSLYEAVTLNLPYSADSEEGYISAVATKEPVPPRRQDRAVPRDLETIVMKCLERNPDHRYASAAEFRDDCTRYLQDRPVMARRPTVVARTLRSVKRHRRAISGLLAASALAVAATYGVLATRARMDEAHRTLEESARARERLHSVLEEVRVTGLGPEQLESNWQRLGAQLREEVRREPHGALANEARVAATRIVARIGSPIEFSNPLLLAPMFDPGQLAKDVPFGLLSHPPVVHLVVGRIFDMGLPIHTVVQLEASVDAGPRTPLGWAGVHFNERRTDSPLMKRSGVCSFQLPSRALVAGPHRVDLRATVTFRDLLASETSAFFHRCGTSPTIPDELAQRPVVAQSTTKLQSATVSLFAEYPADLPRQVDPSATTVSVDTWFKPERLTVVQVRLPRRTGAAFVASDPRWPFTVSPKCAPREFDPAGSVIGFEIGGVFTRTPPVRVAATLDWRPVDAEHTLLSIPLVAGDGVFKFGGPSDPTIARGAAVAGSLSHTVAGPDALKAEVLIRPEGPLAALGSGSGRDPVVISLSNFPQVGASDRFTAKEVVVQPVVWLRELLREKPIAGVVDVRPARDLALAYYFEQYIGPLRRSMTLDVRTLDGQWIDNPSCGSR